MINFKEAEYRIGATTLLYPLTLDIHSGETLILLGKSGSGKTTTLKLINRLIQASSGTITVLGENISGWDPILLRRKIGYVIQEGGLFPHYTVRRNVGVVPALEHWDRAKIDAHVDEALRLVDLDPSIFGERYPDELSGGQRQRVGVARAICSKPEILLMDEPFGALDPISRYQLQNEFRQLQKNLNKTIVFVTHDVSEALLLGTRIAFLQTGRLIHTGTPAELLSSDHPEIRSFLKPARETAQLLHQQ